MRRNGGIVGLIFFLMVVVIFASGAIAVYTIFLKPEKRAIVPQFVGGTTANAVAEAEGLGLVVQIEPVASTLPEGQVLAQSPAANSELRGGQVVLLQVSAGGELNEPPNVVGKTLSRAQNEIKAQGFLVGDIIKIREQNKEPGTVIAQSPSGNVKIVSGRKIDLLVQEGKAQPEEVTVPDINQLSESEAREVLAGNGVKVQAVDKVYSPILTEGTAIETTPPAGTKLKSNQGVILKLATRRRPAGYNDVEDAPKKTTTTANAKNSNTNSNTAANNASSKQTEKPKATDNTNSVTVNVNEEFIGDDYELTTTTTAPASRVANKPTTPAPTTPTPAAQAPAAQTPAPAQAPAPAASSNKNTQASAKPEKTSAPSAPSAPSASASNNKTARIVYPVPPLSAPMDLRIELTDPNGKREVLNRQVRSGELINMSAPYSQECVITIYLGGQFVWQDKQQ